MNTTPKTENRGCKKGIWGNLLTLLDIPLSYDSSNYNTLHKWYERKSSALKDYLSYHNLSADEKQLSTFSYYMLKAYVLYSLQESDSFLSHLQSDFSLFLNHCLKSPLMQPSTKKTYRKIIHPEDVVCFFTFLKNFKISGRKLNTCAPESSLFCCKNKWSELPLPTEPLSAKQRVHRM